METLLSKTGENITKHIGFAIEECYKNLADSLIPNEAHVRGQLKAYRYSLNAMGYDYEISIKIVEDEK